MKRLFDKKWKIAVTLTMLIFAGFTGFRYYNKYRFHMVKETRFMMDTYVSIYAVGPERITAPAIRSALERMQEIDVKFNSRNPESPVYSFNHDGVPISDPEVLDLVKLALEVSGTSDGAFDITVAPLIELWGFYGDAPDLPEKEAISGALKNVGYRNLILEDGKLSRKNMNLRIDLGGIAKGYSVKEAVRVLRDQGVSSALIDAGGDVYALGKKGPEMWKVGIRNPREKKLMGYLKAEDLAVLGSGDYERFFMKDGKRYHHIFDPKTGYPAQGVRATTLIHPDPSLADAWNTAVFVLGPQKGLALVEKMPGMEAIMVTESGEVLLTSGLRDAFFTLEKIE